MREKLTFERSEEKKKETGEEKSEKERKLSERDLAKVEYIKRNTHLGRIVKALLDSENGERPMDKVRKEIRAGRKPGGLTFPAGRELKIFEIDGGTIRLKARDEELNQKLLEYWRRADELGLVRDILEIVEEKGRIPLSEITNRFSSLSSRDTIIEKVKKLEEAGLIQSSKEGKRRILIKKEFKEKKE